MTTRRAAIYCRISAADEGDNNGVTRQLEDCRAIADQRGASVHPDHVFIENDTSATKYGARKLYAKLIELVRSGQVDMIIVWRVDRLIRIPRELEDLIDIAEAGIGEVITATGEMDLTTGPGCLVARVLVAVAKGEIDSKHDRAVRANRQRAEQGKSPQVRCFGYTATGAIVPAEGALVKEVFRRWVNGESINSLCKLLTSTGIPSAGRRRKSSKTTAWTRYGVRLLLSNPRYIAHVHYRGARIADAVAQWDALVDEQTFAAAQTRLSDPSRETKRSPARKWLGSGFYLCGVCGRHMISTGRRRYARDGSSAHERGYRCSSLAHNVRRAERIDLLVEARVTATLCSEEFRDQHRAGASNAAVVQALLDERAALDQLGKQLVADYYDPAFPLSREDYVSQKSRNDALISDLDARVARLLKSDELGELANAVDPVALWNSFDIWRKHKIAAQLLHVLLLPMPSSAPREFNPKTVLFIRVDDDASDAAAFAA